MATLKKIRFLIIYKILFIKYNKIQHSNLQFKLKIEIQNSSSQFKFKIEIQTVKSIGKKLKIKN